MTDARFKDHFSSHAAGYAAHRPTYPPALVDFLADTAPGRSLALDCGCGTGQLSVPLARRFDRVVATDASASQIANAEMHERVEYRTAPAEQSGLPDASADLITVAQAAHWLDLDRFYTEARRVAKKEGILALITYGVLHVEGADIDWVAQWFYYDVIWQVLAARTPARRGGLPHASISVHGADGAAAGDGRVVAAGRPDGLRRYLVGREGSGETCRSGADRGVRREADDGLGRSRDAAHGDVAALAARRANRCVSVNADADRRAPGAERRARGSNPAPNAEPRARNAERRTPDPESRSLQQPSCRFPPHSFDVKIERRSGAASDERIKERVTCDSCVCCKPARKEGAVPTQQEIAAMGQLIDEMTKAGVLLSTEGCQPSGKGARVRLADGTITVTDGPFTESKELIGGFALIEVKSKEEAIEWTKRFLRVAGDGESEIRQMHQAADFAARNRTRCRHCPVVAIQPSRPVRPSTSRRTQRTASPIDAA